MTNERISEGNVLVEIEIRDGFRPHDVRTYEDVSVIINQTTIF